MNPRLPPQNLEAEKSVLGSIFLTNDCYDDVSAIISGSDFYMHGNGLIFDAFKELRGKGFGLDAVTVSELLDRKGLMEEVGGVDYLIEAMSSVPHSVHAIHYAETVKEYSLRRQIIRSSMEADAAARGTDDIETILAKLSDGTTGVLEASNGKTADTSIASALVKTWDGITSPDVRLKTGLIAIDHQTGGLGKRTLNILAARPGVGKTALGVGRIALKVAQKGDGVFVASLEMSSEELLERMFCTLTGFNFKKLQSRHLSEDDLEQLTEAMTELGQLPLWIDDRGGRTVSQIATAARIHKRKHDIKLIVIDYLGFIAPENHKLESHQQTAYNTRKLKELAKELNTPVLLLSQLNRNIEGREVKIPRLSDLALSGAVEQDADQVWFVHRESAYKPREDGYDPDTDTSASLIVAKHRNGKTGTVDLHWNGSTVTYSDPEAAPINDFQFSGSSASGGGFYSESEYFKSQSHG